MTGQHASTARLAASVRRAARRSAAAAPVVRGADWRLATVAVAGTDGTITCSDGVRARRLDSYLNPTVGDLIVLTRSGNGNWVAAGRCATGADTAWTSYTPTWTGGSSNPALGNGTLVGRYVRIGRMITAIITLTSGSTTTYGSGTLSFALPFTAASNGITVIGNAYLLQGATRYGGNYVLSPGVALAAPSFPTSTSVSTQSLWTGTVPIALTTGAQCRIAITYEAAS